MSVSASFRTPDDRQIIIKPADGSFIFAGDMRLNPHTGRIGCCMCDIPIDTTSAIPNEVFEAYHKEVMRRYGQSMILAWDGSRPVGFINFHPLNARFDILCTHVDTAENRKRFEDFQWPDTPCKTLRICCVDLACGYRRMGLGRKLAQTLIDWAPSWGYQRLHTGANETAWWIPCREFWEKLGFLVIEVIEFDEPREDGEVRTFVMERDL